MTSHKMSLDTYLSIKKALNYYLLTYP